MRKALSMLTAIIFIIIIGLLFALTLSLLSKSTQRTTDHFLYNQEQMLARSAVEYTILAIRGHTINSVNGCINKININYNNTFDINVSIHYIGNGFPGSCNVLDNSLGFNEDNGSALIDVKVSLNSSLLDDNPSVTYVRRTIQKL